MPKKLFYASASILMLATAAEVTDLGGGVYTYSIVIGRTLYAFRPGETSGPVGTVPGTSLVVSCAYYSPYTYAALLENGDAWEYNGFSPPGWRFKGNVLCGSTPAAQPTFGQVKVQYRK